MLAANFYIHKIIKEAFAEIFLFNSFWFFVLS